MCEEYHEQYLQQHNDADERFTLQWIVRPDYRVPLTRDVLFADPHGNTPHPVLLDYIYGSAALHAWLLPEHLGWYEDAVMPRRPQRRTNVDIGKRSGTAGARSRSKKSAKNSRGKSGMTADEAFDLMLRITAHTPGAHAYAARLEAEERDRLQSVEAWRRTVQS